MGLKGIKLISADYKIYGKVMDVYFHSYARKVAQRNHILGYIIYASDRTVMGVIQGEPQKMAAMKDWLSKTGSPLSKIDRCLFSNERDITEFEHNSFGLRNHPLFVFWPPGLYRSEKLKY